MSIKVAWIGLGVMGYPMAGHLKTKGDPTLTVFNRTSEKAQRWVTQHGGAVATSPKLAATDADFVFACVGNDDDLREITIGPEGAFLAMKPGAIFVDHTTASSDVARELYARATQSGISFLDAPVSGGQAGAENGTLTAMCGGDPDVYARAEPLLAYYARTRRLLGSSGAGQLAKMCNQIAIAGIVQGLSEAIHFGRKANLDMMAVIEAISQGAAGSWQMDNRHKSMIANTFDFGFAVDWMRKDLSICLNEARRIGAQLPVAALVDQFYSDIQAMGAGRWDTSSLIARLR